MDIYLQIEGVFSIARHHRYMRDKSFNVHVMTIPQKKWIFQRRAELYTTRSEAEKIANSFLIRLGYKTVCQYPIWTGRKIYFADIYIPAIKTIIEIDGGYHYTQKQKRNDRNRSNGLWRLGFHVLRLSNKDARKIEKLKRKISSIV